MYWIDRALDGSVQVRYGVQAIVPGWCNVRGAIFGPDADLGHDWTPHHPFPLVLPPHPHPFNDKQVWVSCVCRMGWDGHFDGSPRGTYTTH
jgi:hypothetical protein